MQISATLFNLTVKALMESLDMKILKVVADMLFPNYNFNEKTGFSDNLSIPRQVAAKQLVSDVKESGLFIRLIEARLLPCFPLTGMTAPLFVRDSTSC